MRPRSDRMSEARQGSRHARRPADPGPPGPEAAERSPFERPAVVWLIVAASVAGILSWPDLVAVLRELRLPDTDDAMRLVQVRDLLAGQGWFDLSQHRHAGAPPMHWSRLVDAPIAALILLVRPFAGPAADGIVAAAWPLLLLGLYASSSIAGWRAPSAGARRPSRCSPPGRRCSSPACSRPGASTTTTSRSARSSRWHCASPGRPRRRGTARRRGRSRRSRSRSGSRRCPSSPPPAAARRPVVARRARGPGAVPRLRPRPRARRPGPVRRPDRSGRLGRPRLRRSLPALALARGGGARHGLRAALVPGGRLARAGFLAACGAVAVGGFVLMFPACAAGRSPACRPSSTTSGW